MHVSQMAYISKTAMRRAKRREIWESWVVVTCMLGIFNLFVFQATLESFGALLFENGLYVGNSWL